MIMIIIIAIMMTEGIPWASLGKGHELFWSRTHSLRPREPRASPVISEKISPNADVMTLSK